MSRVRYGVKASVSHSVEANAWLRATCGVEASSGYGAGLRAMYCAVVDAHNVMARDRGGDSRSDHSREIVTAHSAEEVTAYSVEANDHSGTMVNDRGLDTKSAHSRDAESDYRDEIVTAHSVEETAHTVTAHNAETASRCIWEIGNDAC